MNDLEKARKRSEFIVMLDLAIKLGEELNESLDEIDRYLSEKYPELAARAD